MKANRSLVEKKRETGAEKSRANYSKKRAYPPPQTTFTQEIVNAGEREGRKGREKKNKYFLRGRAVEPGICQATTITRTGRLPVNIFADCLEKVDRYSSRTRSRFY